MFPEANKCSLYSTKTYKNYHFIREDTMTKIISTYIRNTNETFIGIYIGMSLGYIVCYHHVHT